MVNTFGILAALVLGFSAFVAFKNKEQFEQQKVATEQQQSDKDKNTETYKGLVADVELLNTNKDDADKARVELKKKVDDQVKKNDAVQEQITESEKELEDTKNAVATAEQELKERGPLEDLAPKIERLQESTAELKKTIAVLNTQIDRLRGEKSRTAEALAFAKKRLADITSGRSLASMKTSIRSIDRRLGIVTLADGMRAGVVGGSKVAVMRRGEKIGELNVKAVSANLATADVVQSSLKDGENVAPGDTVIPVEQAGGAPAEK